MKQTFTALFFLLSFLALSAQNPAKKQLNIAELSTWKQIKSPLLSQDGNWVAYVLEAEEGNAVLHLWNATTEKTTAYPRGEEPVFSFDNQWLVFKIKPQQDSLKAQRRRKVKKEDLTKDSLGVVQLSKLVLTKTPDVKSFSLPEKWAGWLVFQKEIEKAEAEKTTNDSTKTILPDASLTVAPDSLKTKKGTPKKPKKENKDSGSKLIITELASGWQETVGFVKSWKLAKEGQRILLNSTGNDSTFQEGVYLFDCTGRTLKPLFRGKGTYKSLAFDEQGIQAAFLANLDTTKAQIPPFGLCFFKEGADSAHIVADTNAAFLPKLWLVSENASPFFSKDGTKLFFGIAPPPVLQDTNLLEEEIVNVEVWSHTDGRLHTQQKVRLDAEKNRSYRVVWQSAGNKFTRLGMEDLPETLIGNENNSPMALAYTEQPYLSLISWEGSARKDIYWVEVSSGNRGLIAAGVRGNPQISPAGRYAYWFSEPDTAWFSYAFADKKLRKITSNERHFFYDELNDVPDYPSDYGIAGWTKDDQFLLVYDRYDIWEIDPTGTRQPLPLTAGRGKKQKSRYVRLDPEERFLTSGQSVLLHVFDETTKESGYHLMSLHKEKPFPLFWEKGFACNPNPVMAKDTRQLMFTKENFQTFPDLLFTDFYFKKGVKKVSNANPQQANYTWGRTEMFEWTAFDGQVLQGILVKPEGFDPKKKYPMIVNFYERSSDELLEHRAPFPHRSSINYTFYASRGYLVFNPDIPYKNGYPGNSAYNSVLSGVEALKKTGFVDEARIGLQGHSWGGYQVAYLTTKSNIFRCAEAGAPVVNMTSAYGGIRWETGLSRMFQYEHTQSRIGGTLWEKPELFYENSPLFDLDQVRTPTLILHNDKDGHVPWYQGIEYFSALRRLGKPAWMLNYNEEPHWPLKLQNRQDFQLRMSQFFDYYLKDAPMPKWMERGVPATEKGILQGLELSGEK